MALEKEYDAKQVEAKWQKYWADNGIFRFHPDSGKPVYSIDTPPPTVSGKLHIGHVFSYTQTEIIARYFRMCGHEVYYPFGFDNNGLPTELLAERENGVRASSLSRKEFSALCLETSKRFTAQFQDLWRSLGFSCDWDEVYYTIDDRSQRVSQRSFLDLYRKGYVYRREAPSLWCTRCQTAFAQAEIEDKPKGTTFHFFHFTSAAGGAKIPVATTRPELLSSCVALFVHPENRAHAGLIGGRATVPLFGHEVPILADEKADPDKGTGIVMCCTFGDTTDIEWWRRHDLPLRISFTDDGKMTPLAGEWAGLSIREAREKIVERMLAEGIIFKQEAIGAENRMVNTHERCGTEVEYLVKRQWFVNVIDHKDEIIAAGQQVRWYPDFMKTRFINWVSSLGWDWCISRQRYFGVPIPAWHCRGCGQVILAEEADLPVNPLTDRPRGGACPHCGGTDIAPETDVFDTWATSSVTPQINAKWGERDDRSARMLPMTMRPQAHDIIRTWAFYTVVKSLYHHGTPPWRDAVISGHVLKKEMVSQGDARVAGKDYVRKSKISKSKDGGDQFSPQRIIENHSVDCLRYWTCGATLGADTYYDDGEIDEIRRLLIKLWNAGKFTLENLERCGYGPETAPPARLRAVDGWVLGRMQETLATYHRAFAGYDFHAARSAAYDFFWHDFCDNYLEFSKARLGVNSAVEAGDRESAAFTLHTAFLAILQMLAPFIPHITEELYQAHYLPFEKQPSLHLTRLPTAEERSAPWVGKTEEWWTESRRAGTLLIDLVSAIRSFKTRQGYSLRLPLKRVTVECAVADRPLVGLIALELRDFGVIERLDTADPGTAEGIRVPTAADGLSLGLVPDEEAIAAAALVAAVKAVAVAAKKGLGLPGKAPVPELLLYAAGEGERKMLENQTERLLFITQAAALTWCPTPEGLLPVGEDGKVWGGVR